MDLDFTVQGISLLPSRMESIIREILAHDDLDFIHYDFVSLDTIQEDQEYTGLRISLEARFETLRIPLKIDLTTGDILTPSGMICEYPMIGEDRTLHLYSYNLETVLAEKLETILSRGVFSTRPRDYYDVYILERMQGSKIHRSQLFDALVNTMKKRESDHLIPKRDAILDSIETSDRLASYWKKYQDQFHFASNVTFSDTIHSIRTLISVMNEDPPGSV
jgi:predicted nucleotidyltransferase component of viral defense system